MTIEEGSVFEYCESLFDKLEDLDGGYFPSRHDKYVFSQAATHFEISVTEIERIFREFSKRAADIEIDKIKKLPISVQKKIMMQRAQDILKNNKDLAFFKNEGPPSDEMPSALDVLTEAYRGLVESVAQSGWTIPLSIDIRNFEELKKKVSDDQALEAFFEEFYDGREFRYMCRKIKKVLADSVRQNIFEECVKTYEKKLYTACVTTLITVLEGFISSFGDDPKDVRIMRICNFHASEEMNEGNSIKSLCWLSMYEFTRILFQKSDFSQQEPDMINRHWIQHGRSTRTVEKSSCLRIFNALSTMVAIASLPSNARNDS